MSRGKPLNLEGQRFGRLIVIKRVKNEVLSNGRKGSYWLCQCDCGNTKVVRGTHLTDGNTQSCGCLQRETLLKCRTVHGQFGTRIYGIWANMKNRCNLPTEPNYKNYGGRGISVCEEWNQNFAAFYDWAIQNGYTDELTIDRIDVNGNYEPSNCRWVNMRVQQNNRRNNTHLEFNGDVHTIAEWSRIVNINVETIISRLSRGWTIERALTQPVQLSDAQKAEYERKRGLKRIRKECLTNDSNIQELQSVKPNDG